MQSGKLRRRFTIQTYTATYTDYGETEAQSDDSKWTTFQTRWGSLDPLNIAESEEYEQGDKVSGKVTHQIKIRYTESLTDKMRFKLGSRYFNINKILADRTDARFQIIRVIEKTS